MRRSHHLISGAWLVHAAAWFLPVVSGEPTFPHSLPGREVFRIAASSVWPYSIDAGQPVTIDTWYDAVLSTISAATTVFFILGSVWVVWRGSRAVRRASAWIATAAFAVNAHWYVLAGSDQGDLRIDYFLWWLSFLSLGLGLFDLSRRPDHAAWTGGWAVRQPAER
ncbi:MAG TPA: hypothetical protein VEJ38_10190 [Candidatus Acidoferrales bacterium]|nr:hypothetical protein [Candidatus Acidoferrales bacterium]